MSPPLINWECCGFLSWFYMKQIASKFAPSLDQRIAQIREQMSGPEISQYEKSILGCGPLVWAGL